MTRRISFLTVLVALVLAATGCEPPETAPQNDEVAVDGAEVQAFQSDMQARINAAEGDIARVENRADAVPEEDAEDVRSRAERLREDAADARSRLEMPETASADAFNRWRESVHADVTSLEASVDAALIETAPDIASAESEARERLADIRALIQEVPDPDDRMSLEERAAEVENDIAEATAEADNDLESVRSDLASSVENLRQSVADVDMYEPVQPADETPVDTASDDELATTDDEDYDVE